MIDRVQRGYRIGDVQINISAPEYNDAEYLAVFRNDGADADACFEISFKHAISEPELPLIHKGIGESWYSDGEINAYTLKNSNDSILLKTSSNGKQFKVEFDAAHPDYFGAHAVMKSIRLPELMFGFDAIFLHSSFIIHEGKAILFTAERQVGKSTQAALWKKYMAAEIANGDRALIRQIDGIWTAFGSPYSGTSGICKSMSAPIAAIVMLGQAKENQICKATTREAVAAMLSGTSYNLWNESETEKCLQIVEKLVSEVAFYKLDCLPDKTAVTVLNDFMMENLK